jgi:hypothetical protein
VAGDVDVGHRAGALKEHPRAQLPVGHRLRAELARDDPRLERRIRQAAGPRWIVGKSGHERGRPAPGARPRASFSAKIDGA